MSQTKAQLIDPVDGSIVNADINASAAIAGSKISPDFGSQNIATTGSLGASGFSTTGGEIALTGTVPRIGFTDSNANSDFRIKVDGGSFQIEDTTNSSVDRLVINSSGNVGIGTASPAKLLDVKGGDGATVEQYLRNNTINLLSKIATTDNAQFGTETAHPLLILTSNSERMRITSSGNVGIGTSSPSAKLEINNTGSPNSELLRLVNTQHDTNAQSSSQLKFGITNSLGERNARIEAKEESNNTNDVALDFYTNSTSSTDGETIKMRVTAAGNVGIGTTSPATLLNLDVDTESNLGSGSKGIRLTSGSSNAQFVRLGSSYSNNSVTGPGTLLFSSNKLSLRCDNGNPITFHTGSTVAERMRIDASGNVGIGVTPADTFSFSRAVDIGSTSGGFYYARDTDAGSNAVGGVGYSGTNLFVSNKAAGNIRFLCNTDATERMRIDSSGRLLIGTTVAVGSVAPVLQVKAATSDGFNNHIYLEGSETNGSADTGGAIGFGGHDGSTARNWAQIVGRKFNSIGGNTSSYLGFNTRRSGVSGINEMFRITAMGSFLARNSKESAIGREYTNGNVPAGQTRDFTDDSRLNFNGIGGNGGGHITCLSISSQDQSPSGAMIITGVHGAGFNSYVTHASNFDSGISVTFNGTVTIQNTSSETIYYSVNVIHMGTGNTTYLGR